MLSSLGKAFNDIMGTTSAGKASQKYALKSMEVNNAYQKEFAKNAHQWEIEDLKKAGLNPVLSAGGGGASASGGGIASGSETGSGINPVETAINAWNGIQQAENTGADTANKNATTANINADTENKIADTQVKHAQKLLLIAQTAKTEKEKEESEARAYQILTMTPAQYENQIMDTKLKRKTKEKMTSQKKAGAGIDLGIFGRLGLSGELEN